VDGLDGLFLTPQRKVKNRIYRVETAYAALVRQLPSCLKQAVQAVQAVQADEPRPSASTTSQKKPGARTPVGRPGPSCSTKSLPTEGARLRQGLGGADARSLRESLRS
jgi:hypothetical protein